MENIALELPGKKPELYPITFQKVKELDKVITGKLMEWKKLPMRGGMQVKNYYGKVISYEGVTIDGSPRLVFWDNFIEPFLENGTIDILNATYQMCAEKNLTPYPYIKEACEILKLLNRKTYKSMSRIDQVSKGNGFPDSVTPKNVDEKINKMDQFIASHFIAILKKGKKPKDSSSEDVIEIKPNIWGFGLNLNALWRKVKKYIT